MRRKLRRGQVTAFFAQLEPCLVGMEACSGANYWSRTLSAQGHEAPLLALDAQGGLGADAGPRLVDRRVVDQDPTGDFGDIAAPPLRIVVLGADEGAGTRA